MDSSNKKYTHLFFDLDHTLWDFDANARLAILDLYATFNLKARGIKDAEDFYRRYLHHNNRLWIRYRNGYIKREQLRFKRFWHTLLEYKINDQELIKALNDRYVEVLPQQTLLLPYTHELLKHCKQHNYQLHLISNGFETTQIKKLKNTGLDCYFEQLFTSEQCLTLKPNKEIFEYAFKATQAEAMTSLMIGDSYKADIIGAQQVGMDQAFIKTKEKHCTTEQATYKITCLSQLIGLL